MQLLRTFGCAVLLFVGCLTPAFGAAISDDNVLVSTNDVLYEYTPLGVFVQSFPIPYATGPRPVTESARDIAASSVTKEVYVYNGTFTPYLSLLDSVLGTWSHQLYAGWSTVANVSYGGVAYADQYVFATDMATAGAGAPQGIVRFDSLGSTTRFATGIEPIDLNVGLNGMLYALDGRYVSVYHPETLALKKTVDLYATIANGDYRSIAANESGQLFIVTWAGNLYKTDGNGNVIASVNLCGVAGGCNLVDVDVSAQGVVAVGNWGGSVVITDEALSSPTSFPVGLNETFVAFPADPPIGLPVTPVAVLILGVLLGLVAVIIIRQKKKYKELTA